MKTILLTGATGYIGSHGAVALLENGYNVIIIDNLSNSSKSSLKAIEKITGKKPKFYEIDLRNKEKLESVFKENKIDSVIHFAGAKAVGESCELPFYYYDNNITGSLKLFELMDKYEVKNIIFSSSATVYRPELEAPFSEETPTGNTTNPYGTTKLIIENILRDLSNHKGFNIINLRYFNPVGAHSSGLIGEDPNDKPNNLLPFILKVASGELEQIQVFGDDYPTKDGTGERDYIHVVDLIEGHVKALEYIEKKGQTQGTAPTKECRGESCIHPIYEEINLGTGTPTSVLEMIDITEEIIGRKLDYKITKRRTGDIAISYCNPKKAKEILDWEAKKSIFDAISDSWNFIQNK